MILSIRTRKGHTLTVGMTVKVRAQRQTHTGAVTQILRTNAAYEPYLVKVEGWTPWENADRLRVTS